MPGGNPKRQHWVPRFYLREFATPETRDTEHPFVWVASKKPKGVKDELPFTMNVENVAAESFLYSPRQSDGTRDFSVEKLLSGLEGLLSQRWDHVANNFVDLENETPLRKILALFMATMIVRHPDHVHQMRDVHARHVQIYDSAPKDSNGRPKISHVVHDGVRREFDASGWEEFRNADENYIRQAFAENIQPAGAQLSADLLAKKWSIVVADEPVFATSDRPVRMRHPAKKVFGTRTPGTIIEFPLSPTRFLMLHDFPDRPQFGYHPLKGGPGPLNLSTWFSAERFLITGTDPMPLIKQFMNFARTENRRYGGIPESASLPGRNAPCPCGSGKKFKRCCTTVIRGA